MYMQMSTSLTLFAVHNVRNDIFGFVIPPEGYAKTLIPSIFFYYHQFY